MTLSSAMFSSIWSKTLHLEMYLATLTDKKRNAVRMPRMQPRMRDFFILCQTNPKGLAGSNRVTRPTLFISAFQKLLSPSFFVHLRTTDQLRLSIEIDDANGVRMRKNQPVGYERVLKIGRSSAMDVGHHLLFSHSRSNGGTLRLSSGRVQLV